MTCMQLQNFAKQHTASRQACTLHYGPGLPWANPRPRLVHPSTPARPSGQVLRVPGTEALSNEGMSVRLLGPCCLTGSTPAAAASPLQGTLPPVPTLCGRACMSSYVSGEGPCQRNRPGLRTPHASYLRVTYSGLWTVCAEADVQHLSPGISSGRYLTPAQRAKHTGAHSGLPYPSATQLALTAGPTKKPECRRHTLTGRAASLLRMAVGVQRGSKNARSLGQLHPRPS